MIINLVLFFIPKRQEIYRLYLIKKRKKLAYMRLNSKTLRPVTAKQKSIESKKVIFYVTTSGIGGLYILKVLHNPKSATIIINVGYIARLVSWVNANMYLSSSCEVKMSDNGFDVTITTNQIDGTENFSCTCVGIG